MVCPVADTPSKLPAFVAWPSFPFEGQLRPKRLDPPVAEEPPREGEDPSTCTACAARDDAYIWASDRWRVRSMDRPSGLPAVLILESRSHLDLGDLTNLLAAELGVMTVRLERAIRSLDGVERVHVNRWGDGAAHLHLWFLARPVGQLQLRGSFLSLWDDILEPIPEHIWRENLAHIAAWLADFGGRAIAEPPRIEWHAPSSFSDVNAESSTFDAATDHNASAGLAETSAAGLAETPASERSALVNGDSAAVVVTTETAELVRAAGNGGGAVPAPRDGRAADNATGSSGDGSSNGRGPDRSDAQSNGVLSNGAQSDGAQSERGQRFAGRGLDGEGWTLSADDIEESDILI